MKPNQLVKDVRRDETRRLGTAATYFARVTGSSTGRQCEGYQIEGRRAKSPQVAKDSGCHDVLTLYRLSAVPDQSPIEARCLQYFSEKTITQLTYFFPDDLWNITVLQVAQSNPGVRHAISSLSWYHERFVCQTTAVGDEASFALVQYNLAIKDVLINQVPYQPVHIGVISCLLFVCIEVGYSHAHSLL